jgi:hypothetical protein
MPLPRQGKERAAQIACLAYRLCPLSINPSPIKRFACRVSSEPGIFPQLCNVKICPPIQFFGLFSTSMRADSNGIIRKNHDNRMTIGAFLGNRTIQFTF